MEPTTVSAEWKWDDINNYRDGDYTPHGRAYRDFSFTRIVEWCKGLDHETMFDGTKQAVKRSKEELLLLINRAYGYIWQTIPPERVDEICTWIESGAWDSRYMWTCPDLYQSCRSLIPKEEWEKGCGWLDYDPKTTAKQRLKQYAKEKIEEQTRYPYTDD